MIIFWNDVSSDIHVDILLSCPLNGKLRIYDDDNPEDKMDNKFTVNNPQSQSLSIALDALDYLRQQDDILKDKSKNHTNSFQSKGLLSICTSILVHIFWMFPLYFLHDRLKYSPSS